MSQSNWRWCNRCQGLFFAGSGSVGGVCPAKGIHSDAGSSNYEVATSGSGQSDWRCCSKCQGLYYAGSWKYIGVPDLGVCPAGGSHADTGSSNFTLADSGSGQSDWQWCNKCQGLFYAGNWEYIGVPELGVCPAGGAHSNTGSGNYVLASATAKQSLTILKSLSLVNTSKEGIGFVAGDNGHAYLYNSSGAVWTDLGAPPGGTTWSQLAAVYQPTLNRIIVFVVNVDANISGPGGFPVGSLYDVYFDLVGFTPTWESQGMIPASVTPSGTEIGIIGTFAQDDGVSMLIPVYQSKTDEIYLFVVGSDGNLYDFHLSGTTWVWEAHGTPPGTSISWSLMSTSSAIFDPVTGQIYVFLTGSDNHLWDRHSSGSTWEWADHGPLPMSMVPSNPSAVCQSGGQIFVFNAAGNAVYCTSWNGTEWQLTTLPTPAPASNCAAAVDAASNQVIVTATVNSGLMYAIWNGTSWSAFENTGIEAIQPGLGMLQSPGFLSMASPPQILAGVLPGSGPAFSLVTGYYNETTKKWVWQLPQFPPT